MTPRRRPTPRRPDSGAVFVEALVAAAIVAMILASTLRVISDGASRERLLGNRRMAVLLAQSELAAVGAEIPLEPGETAGFAGPLVWRTDISPYDAAGGPNSVGALMRVRVSVRPRSGGPDLVELDSLRLGRGG